MGKIIEKIKKLLSADIVFRSKCSTKKEEPKPQQKEPNAEQKPEEQKINSL